ncbi:MAG: RNA polymerase sigma factor [Sedimentisphaerales bacterium]|nr:RNA polymerase sigma factor [Sedimentisphaerales bacterium]
MDSDSERFAIGAAQRGSEQAWRQLFEWHFDAVYQYCVALSGGRCDLAEELTQQVFVVAAQRIHRFDVRQATFRAWLFGIVKNRHKTMQDREQRRKRHEESSIKTGSSASQSVRREIPDLQVHEVLAQLPGHYRIVLEAKYLRGLSMKEIASDSGASIEAIESLLRRARADFARVYEQIRTLE